MCPLLEPAAACATTEPPAAEPAGRTKRRRRFRGVPMPLAFDIMTLPDSAVLTTKEVSAATRISIERLDKLRMVEPGHCLRWVRSGRNIRYTAKSVKSYLSGRPQEGPKQNGRGGAAPTYLKLCKYVPTYRSSDRSTASDLDERAIRTGLDQKRGPHEFPPAARRQARR